MTPEARLLFAATERANLWVKSRHFAKFDRCPLSQSNIGRSSKFFETSPRPWKYESIAGGAPWPPKHAV
jgi:hypothetical protein